MTSKLAWIACVAVLATGLAACGSSKKSSSNGTTSSTPTTTTADERAQAKTALDTWLKLVAKVNAAFSKYGKDEPAHASQHNVLAVRRDGYDLRNAVYRFDQAVRKIKFPESMRIDVNSLLETNARIIAALDGLSQSSKSSDVDRYIRKSNAVDLKTPTHKINVELHRLAGEPLPASGSSTTGGSEADRVAQGLLKAKDKSGAKGPDDSACAAKLLVKKLGKSDLDKIAAGQIPQSGPTSNEIGAALLACQLNSG